MAFISDFLFTKRGAALLAVIPVAVPTAYIIYLKVSLSRHYTSASGKRDSSQPRESILAINTSVDSPKQPISLPSEVSARSSVPILSHERVITSHPNPASSLRPSPLTHPAEFLTAYSRLTMEAFSWTPQAFAIRAAIKDESARRTFDRDWICSREFEVGDVVNGVYKVSYRDDEKISKDSGGPAGGEGEGGRIEFMLAPPASYTGLVVKGMIVSGFERVAGSNGGDGEKVVVYNETWMWRDPGEKKTMLETGIGRWMHSLLAAWLISKGIKGLKSE